MQYKFTLAHFQAPTPKKIRKIGNALVTISSSISLPTAFAGNLWAAGIISGLGIVGKILLSFYTEDSDTVSPPNTNTNGSN